MNPLNLFAVSALINGIVSITFGVLVLAKNWRDKMNRIFFFMSASLAIWSFSYWQWQLSANYDTALMWVRLLSAGSLFIPIFFYHWVIKLVEAEVILNKVILWFAYLAALVTLCIVNTNLFITGLEHKSFFNFWPDSGIAYDIYFCYTYLGLIAYALYILLRAHSSTEDKNKKGQILSVILGCVFGFGGGLTNFPLWWGINIPPFGNFLISTFPFLLGYSVLKYKLFNLKTIISELLVFALLVFMSIIVLLADSWTLKSIYGFFFVLMSAAGVILVKNSYAVEIANAGQENLIHIMNHQIKGYLAKARGIFSELLIEPGYGPLPDAAKPLVLAGLKTMTEGVEFTQQLLNASSVEKGTLTYMMGMMDMRALVEDVALSQKELIEKKNLAFSLRVADGDYRITGDPLQLKEAVRNLLDNSMHYTQSGSIDMRLTREANFVLICIADTGVGLAESDKNKLFTKGGRGEESLKINVNSTGYGLFFAKGVIDAHHGRIWAESEGRNMGTTFFVELPVNQKSISMIRK